MKRFFLAVFICLSFTVFLLISGCGGPGGGYQVRYELTGDITAEEIIYFDEAGDEVTDYGITPPWDYNFSTTNESRGIKLGAYNITPAYYGTLTVEIFIDGESVLYNTDSSSTAIGANTGTYTLGDLVD